MKTLTAVAILLISIALVSGCTTYAEGPGSVNDYESKHPRFQADVPYGTNNINENSEGIVGSK